jgi:uncharacterized phage-associated protein
MIGGLFLIVLTAGCFLPKAAQAIEIQPIGTGQSEIAISISGEIDSGDDEKLSESLQAAQNKRLEIGFINLNSPGGIVSAGAGMARIIRNRQIKTRVKAGSTCASACFMLFAAGKERYAESGARIGVHSAVNQQLGETKDAKSTTIDMARFLSELDVPPGIIGKVVTTKPDQIAWLTNDDLRGMRVHGAPAVLPTESYVERVAPKIPTPAGVASIKEQRQARTLLVQSTTALRIGSKADALAFAESAARLVPYDVDILSAYGYALYMNEKNQEAIDKTLLAVRISPSFPGLYRVLALANAALSKEPEAYENFVQYYKYSTNKDNVVSELNYLAESQDATKVMRFAAKRALATAVK